MLNQEDVIYDSHNSKTTRYYGLIFLLIFAIPIGILLFLMLEGPLFFTVIMFSTLIGLYIGMAYFTLTSGSLKYELSSKEFRIRFGLITKR